MEFRILGPLEVVIGDRALGIEGAKPSAVLALLALHAGEVVAAERLIQELWQGRPPETAANTLQVYVSKLRKALRAASPGAEDVLTTRRPGYVLQIEPEQVDAVRFERLAAEGRAALERGDAPSAARTLREALALWHGEALADVAEPFARRHAARLADLRLAALEARIDAELALGKHAELVGELAALVRQHPLRERLRAQLMVSLYRSGRQADALQAYQDARSTLVEELGLEPGPELQRLERAILVHDASLEVATPVPQASAERAPERPARDVRKTVTVLFVDLAPAPLRGREIDPEALRRVHERWVTLVKGVVERHGGTADAVSAGVVRAVFGVPDVHEDDALRATRAAVDLRGAAVALDDELRQWGVSVFLRAGMETGDVIVGDPSPSGAEPTGESVALARRLQEAAAHGDVLVGEATRRLLQDAARLEEMAPVPLPGEGRSAPAWRLLDVAQHAEAIPRRLGAPMLGRELELAQLKQAFERCARERRCSLFTILGPAGIGKSRLVEELRAAIGDDGQFLSGRCLSYGDGITFWPIVEVVRQALGDDVRAALVDVLGDDENGRLIAQRVAGAIGVGEAAGGGEETFWAVRKLFEALARRRPLILVLDDVHWAEPTLLDLVEHVADWTRDAPILLVCLARPELLDVRPGWGGGKLNAASILLEPLTDSESEALIGNLLGRADLPPDAVARIAEAAGGNPLFVEQTVSMLIDDGLLVRRRGRWTLDRELAAVSVPASINALLEARLGRLDAGERRVIEAAAVIGKVFWAGAIAALTGDERPDAADSLLQRLLRRELVAPDRSTFAGEEGFRFRHVLIREAAYQTIPKRIRAELHERFAEWLERVGDERAGELEEIIGYHLEQAHRYRGELAPLDERGRELAVRGGERLAAAGERAFARGDMPGAVSLLARSAALLPDGHRLRPVVLLGLAHALRESGDFAWAGSVLDELLELATTRADRTLDAHATVLRLRMQLEVDPTVATDALMREAERAIAAFEQVGDDRGLANAWFLVAWIPWLRCQAAATEAALEHAIEHGRRGGDERAYYYAVHLFLGTALYGPLPVADGVRRCEEVLAREESRRIEASAVRALAVLRAMEGDFAEARRLVARDRELLEDLGLRFLAASAREAYAMVDVLAGDLAAAATELQSAYDALEQMASTSALSTIAAMLAEVEQARGRSDEALRLSEVAEAAAASEDLSSQVQWRGARAKVLAERGHVADAERLAREAVALAERTDFLSLHAGALVDLADVLATASHADDATAALSEALLLYRRKGNVVAAGRTEAVLKSGRAAPVGAPE